MDVAVGFGDTAEKTPLINNNTHMTNEVFICSLFIHEVNVDDIPNSVAPKMVLNNSTHTTPPFNSYSTFLPNFQSCEHSHTSNPLFTFYKTSRCHTICSHRIRLFTKRALINAHPHNTFKHKYHSSHLHLIVHT